MALSDIQVKNAKPGDKPRRLFDGDGLYLEISPNGGKWWRFKYRFSGKEKRLSLGVYDDVGLKEARDLRDEARKLLAKKIDPGVQRKMEKRAKALAAVNTFEAIGREWWQKKNAGWSKSYRQATMDRLEKQLFPSLGSRPLAEVDPPALLDVIRAIERRGALEVASKTLVTAGQVFRYAIATARATSDPTRDLRGSLQARERHHYAALSRDELPAFLDALENYDGSPITKLATRLLMLTFVRTAELRGAKWPEFDENRAEWRIPADRMKMRTLHIVPLSTQSLDALRTLRQITGDKTYLFPNEHHPDRFMSENTILFALYRMGYRGRATGHGFRSTASTILNEMGFRADVIERQLAHNEQNKVRKAYNHAQYLPERKKLMQAWADFLGSMNSNNVVTAKFLKTANA